MGTQMLYVGADGYLWVEKEIPGYLTVPSLYHENDTIYNSWSYAPSEASVRINFFVGKVLPVEYFSCNKRQLHFVCLLPPFFNTNYKT